MAFRTIGRTLRNYFLDRRLGAIPDAGERARAKAPRPDLAGAG